MSATLERPSADTRPPDRLYAWAAGYAPGIKAPVFATAYNRLAGQLGRAPEATDVVQAARPARHPLHRAFEWDDKTAADAFRLDQANDLIRNLRVHFSGGGFEEQPVRAYFRVDIDGERTWAAHDVVVQEPDLQEQVLRDILSDLQAFCRKYAVFLIAIGAEPQAVAFQQAIATAVGD